MQPSPSTPDENYQEIAAKVRSGEYFREARQAYHIRYHDPIAERYLYMALTLLSLMVLGVAVLSYYALLPLKQEVPVTYRIQDVVEDLPHIKPLGARGQDTNHLLMHFLVTNYVTMRESYNVLTLDRNANGIRGHSTPEIFEEYQRMMDPHNPNSPIALYQRHSTRSVDISSISLLRTGEEKEVEVLFDAVVQTGRERKKNRMIANIAFRFDFIAIDQGTGGFTPLNFVVTRYQSRRLQD